MSLSGGRTKIWSRFSHLSWIWHRCASTSLRTLQLNWGSSLVRTSRWLLMRLRCRRCWCSRRILWSPMRSSRAICRISLTHRSDKRVMTRKLELLCLQTRSWARISRRLCLTKSSSLLLGSHLKIKDCLERIVVKEFWQGQSYKKKGRMKPLVMLLRSMQASQRTGMRAPSTKVKTKTPFTESVRKIKSLSRLSWRQLLPPQWTIWKLCP